MCGSPRAETCPERLFPSLGIALLLCTPTPAEPLCCWAIAELCSVSLQCCRWLLTQCKAPPTAWAAMVPCFCRKHHSRKSHARGQAPAGHRCDVGQLQSCTAEAGGWDCRQHCQCPRCFSLCWRKQEMFSSLAQGGGTSADPSALPRRNCAAASPLQNAQQEHPNPLLVLCQPCPSTALLPLCFPAFFFQRCWT